MLLGNAAAIRETVHPLAFGAWFGDSENVLPLLARPPTADSPMDLRLYWRCRACRWRSFGRENSEVYPRSVLLLMERSIRVDGRFRARLCPMLSCRNSENSGPPLWL